VTPRISIVTLGVADLERSRKFYEAGLGWPVSSDSGDEIVFLRLGGTILSLYSYASLAEETNLPANRGIGFGGITLAQNFKTRAEVDQVMATAEAAGATILAAPVDRHWGGYSGYFADPDGYAWEVAWGPNFEYNDDGSLKLAE
jgi:uncharacterized protein